MSLWARRHPHMQNLHPEASVQKCLSKFPLELKSVRHDRFHRVSPRTSSKMPLTLHCSYKIPCTCTMELDPNCWRRCRRLASSSNAALSFSSCSDVKNFLVPSPGSNFAATSWPFQCAKTTLAKPPSPRFSASAIWSPENLRGSCQSAWWTSNHVNTARRRNQWRNRRRRWRALRAWWRARWRARRRGQALRELRGGHQSTQSRSLHQKPRESQKHAIVSNMSFKHAGHAAKNGRNTSRFPLLPAPCQIKSWLSTSSIPAQLLGYTRRIPTRHAPWLLILLVLHGGRGEIHPSCDFLTGRLCCTCQEWLHFGVVLPFALWSAHLVPNRSAQFQQCCAYHVVKRIAD